MRTSRKHLDESYIKLPENQPMKGKEVIIISENIPSIEPNIYQKHLDSNKQYYQKNKKDILERNKKNYESKDKNVLARNKILHLLNNDATYKTKVKQSTLEKHNIKIQDGVYI